MYTGKNTYTNILINSSVLKYIELVEFKVGIILNKLCKYVYEAFEKEWRYKCCKYVSMCI